MKKSQVILMWVCVAFGAAWSLAGNFEASSTWLVGALVIGQIGGGSRDE